MYESTRSLVSSKTFWLAVVQAVIGVIVIFSSAYPAAGWLLTAKSVLDVVLRMMTTQPIGSIT